MMRRALMACAILFLLTGKSYSHMWLDGDEWKRFKDLAAGDEAIEELLKVTYVRAVYETIAMVKTRLGINPRDFIPSEMDFGEIFDALDKFYSDPKNTKIPALWVLSIISMREKGESKETIERKIQELRRLFGT